MSKEHDQTLEALNEGRQIDSPYDYLTSRSDGLTAAIRGESLPQGTPGLDFRLSFG